MLLLLPLVILGIRGPRETICRRPFPTSPKLADEATASRVLWKGDQATIEVLRLPK